MNLGKLTTSENENKLKGTLHIVLFAIIFTINVGISLYFVTRVMFGTRTQANL